MFSEARRQRGNFMEIRKVALKSIRPYERNPRHNDGAVESVAQSIRQCGYCAPIIVDEELVILAGHTRYKALQALGWQECEVCIVPGLTDEKKRKYRLLDNKTGELAKWDFTLLDQELQSIDFEDFDFGFTSFADVDFAAGSEELENEYREPQKKQLRCPFCNHVDSAERFVRVADG